jgi:DNA-binding response OmpR family regulator
MTNTMQSNLFSDVCSNEQTSFYQFHVLSYCVKILHVEDVPEISQIFADILSTKNCEFESVSDGRAGLELAVYHDYDLILLDMCMPKYSGVDFLLDLKHRRPTQLSKVVIVSALEMSSLQEQELLNLGIRSILRKPISVQGLLSQIQQKIAF